LIKTKAKKRTGGRLTLIQRETWTTLAHCKPFQVGDFSIGQKERNERNYSSYVSGGLSKKLDGGEGRVLEHVI